jgi:hypothetical protein
MALRTFLIAGIALLALPSTASAADHSLTAIAAGGITEQSLPFQNGLNNLGRNSEDVPGQGSPLYSLYLAFVFSPSRSALAS